VAELDAMLAQGVRAAFKLPQCFPGAPILMGKEDGGMALESCAVSMTKEIQIHFAQCMGHNDELSELVRGAMEEALLDEGVHNAKELQKALAGRERESGRRELGECILGRAQNLLKAEARACVGWWKRAQPDGVMMAPALNEREDEWERQEADIQVGFPEEGRRAVEQRKAREAARKALRALHRAGIFSLQDMLDSQSGDIRGYASLPKIVQKKVSRAEFECLVKEMGETQGIRESLGSSRKQPLSKWLEKEREKDEQEKELEDMGGKEQKEEWDDYDCEASAYEDLMGWELQGEGEAHPWRAKRLIGKHILWTTEQEKGRHDTGMGTVVAVRNERGGPMARVLFHWGACEDLPLKDVKRGFEKKQGAEAFLGEEKYVQQTNFADWYARKWGETAPARLRDQVRRSRARFKGIEGRYLVRELHGEEEGDWTEMCYRFEEDGRCAGRYKLWKQRMAEGRFLEDEEPEGEDLPPEEALGRHTTVKYSEDDGVVDQEDWERLEEWAKRSEDRGNRDPPINWTKQPAASKKSSIKAHFSTSSRPPKEEAKTFDEVEPSREEVRKPWEGRTQKGMVTFDWGGMTPTVTFAKEGRVVAVGRNGEVRLFRKEGDHEGAQGRAPMGEILEYTTRRQTAVTKGYKKIGAIDGRMAAALEELRRPSHEGDAGSEEDGISRLAEALEAESASDQLHWRFADDLRGVQGATQFVGADLLNAHPGYGSLVSTKKHRQDMGFDSHLRDETTVAWLEGIDRAEWDPLMKELKEKRVKNLLVMYKSSRSAAKPKEKGWRMLTFFPSGALKMASGKAPILHPAGCKEILEIWAWGETNGAEAQASGPGLDAAEETAASLEDLQDRTGGRWATFLKASQEHRHLGAEGRVVATDGSVRPSGEDVITGAGVAFRRGDEPKGDIVREIVGAPTSFGAEGGAVETALDETDDATPLTILTDSANIMFALQHCSRNDWWRDFDSHKDRDMLERLASKIARRTASTTFVKVKAHASVPLNERADELAGKAGQDDGAAKEGYRTLPPLAYYQQADPNETWFEREDRDRDGEEITTRVGGKEIAKIMENKRNAHLCKTSTRAGLRLSQPGMGRRHFAAGLWDRKKGAGLRDTTIKRTLQVLTNTYPTQSLLCKMGVEDTDECPFCHNGRETLFHWQSECTQFSNARTQVHDEVWKAAWNYITAALSAEEGWTTFRETTIRETPLKYASPTTGLRKPDGILYCPKQDKWILLDLTRGRAANVTDFERARRLKEEDYKDLIADLRSQGQEVKFFALPVSYDAAIDVKQWTEALGVVLEKGKGRMDRLLEICSRQLMLGIDTMVEARNLARKMISQSGNLGGGTGGKKP
jgi:ribonuclease HI